MRIYIVDDDRNIYSILKQIITERKLGEICGSAENGQEALEDVASLKPDIIIADLLMPDLDGITFPRRPRSSFRTPASSCCPRWTTRKWCQRPMRAAWSSMSTSR